MALADPVLLPERLIRSEPVWRQCPRLQPGEMDRLVISRWISSGACDQACDAVSGADRHILEVHLRRTDAALTTGGAPVQDGKLAAGSALLTEAGRPLEARYRGPCDLLHLFVPVRRFEALLREAGIAFASVKFGRVDADPVVTRLALSLLGADDMDGPGARVYSESIATAMLARVVGQPSAATESKGTGRTGLVKWRHRRVVDFIEANLAEPIRLPDLARAAGLSRMHFAAQFRAATGVRPHEFVVRRRIERAQDLLRDPTLQLAQIALGVGFQTQAHFTTVFREHVHETPGRWRQLHCSPDSRS
jgi:AraC-like DNA-binding protein